MSVSSFLARRTRPSRAGGTATRVLRRLALTAVFGASVGFGAPAQALPIPWTLDNVNLGSTTLTGGFTTDGSGHLVTWNLTDSLFGGVYFTNTNGSANLSTPSLIVLCAPGTGCQGELFLSLAAPLDSGVSPNAILPGPANLSKLTWFGTPFYASSGGDVSTVPEPTTIAVLGMGLMGIGLVRRRRTAA
jgi:hypothetical protein